MGWSERSFLPATRSPIRARLLLALAAGACPAAAAGQSVSPPIAEYQEHARSSFQLSNQSIFPLTVVLEVKGFQVTERGEVQDAPFDSTRIHLKLSTMSFRIPPRGTYTVFYEVRADSAPAWFNILSAMSGARTDAGVNVRILLPHVVYLNQKQPLRRDEVMVRAFELDSAAKLTRVQLENTGPNLGRVLQVSATSGKTQSPPGSAFPLFPHSRRWTEIPWTLDSIPRGLEVRFAKFTIDTALTPTRVAAARNTAVSDSTGR
jgi:hypothetical protein